MSSSSSTSSSFTVFKNFSSSSMDLLNWFVDENEKVLLGDFGGDDDLGGSCRKEEESDVFTGGKPGLFKPDTFSFPALFILNDDDPILFNLIEVVASVARIFSPSTAILSANAALILESISSQSAVLKAKKRGN